MITDNLVVNGLIKVTSQAEVNTLTADQVNDTSGEDIAQLQGATSNVQEQINALATSYDESIDNSTEFKTGVANAVNSLSDEPNLNSESTLEQYVTAISLLGGKNYKGRLTASDDLDNVSDDGFYDIVSTDQPVHIPSDCGGMNACVEVFNLPEIETIYQRYHIFQGGVFTYSRRKFNGAWSNWVAYTFGVKGNAEASYRSGNVNITPENIGATPNYSYTIDLSNTSTYLESNWYPVVGNAIPSTGMHHIKLHVHLDSGTKPSWSTHDRGFSCNMDLRVKAAGWGTTMHHSICLEYDCLWCQDNINPCGYTQLTTASFPVLWLRGGGKYFVETDYKCEWSPKSSTYTVNSDSVSPATSCPGIQFNRSTVYANLDGSVNGNASSATKLQTTRTIFGQSFDGSANIGGKALVYGTYNSTAANRYGNSALEIRENGLVGSAQSDFGYAPSIGFHWSGKVAATLSMHTDGIFYFRKQDGTTRATIDANVKGDIYNSIIDSSNKVDLNTTALSGYTSPLTPQYINYMQNGPVSIVDYLLILGTAIEGICSDAIPKAGTSNITGNLMLANSTSTTLTGTSLRGLYGVVGDNDGWRIAGGGASNEGFLEIATCDDATEPIYVRQYSNGGGGLGYANLARTLTLLDGSGNTSIPGNLTVGGTIYGAIEKSNFPTGFGSRTTSSPWGNTTGTHVTGWDIDNCCIAFMKNNPSSGKLSAKIDGYFYQNEGQYRVLDTTDYDNLKSNFQVGVDSIYNAIVAQGTTPASKSLSDVTAGIAKLGSGRYKCISWSYIAYANHVPSSSATEYFNLSTSSSSWKQVCTSSENSWYRTIKSELAGKLSSESFAICRISGYNSSSGIRRGNGYSSGSNTASYRYLSDITIIANNYTTSSVSNFVGHGSSGELIELPFGLYGSWYDCNLADNSSSAHKSQDVWFNIGQTSGDVRVTFAYCGARTLWLKGDIKFEFWVFYT